MATSIRILALMACATAAFTSILAGSRAISPQKNAVKRVPPTEDLQNILSWFPADTETIYVANGPFSFPDLTPPEQPSPFHSASADELKTEFEAMALSLVGFRSGVLSNRVIDQKVVVAIEGSRHFRAPTGLGETLFEGCSAVIFARDESERTGAFLKESLAADHSPEKIEGQSVTIFNEQLESDAWTILIAFPKPDTILACSSRNFLRELLVRMHGDRGSPRTSAFPDSLPEWSYVNASTRFWAIRHFEKSQAGDDPTSPFAAEKPAGNSSDASTDQLAGGPAKARANPHDGQAIGVTFNFDPYKSWSATITYLSGDLAIASKLRDSAYFAPGEPAAAPLRTDLHEISPGVNSISYELEDRNAIRIFQVLLNAALGHAI